MNLDKSTWSKVKLGDVVTKREENDKENAKSRFDRFLKVEHLDAESLHIKRWASQKEEELPPTFYKIFRKGQILFPTRNPHLRRTAIAPFDGICGEKTLTLEPKQDIVLQAYLAFLFHSDAFYAHATSAIIGSTNPHVRWRDVSSFEFLLPPRDLQAVLAEFLWSGDKALESDLELERRLTLLLDAEVESKIHGEKMDGLAIRQVIENLSKRAKVNTLAKMGDVLKGRGIAKSEVIESGIPCVRYGELYTKHHRIIRKFYSCISQDSARLAIKLKTNDILFAGSGETITEIGQSSAFVGNEDAYAGSDILIFRPKDMDGTYLGYLMNSQLVRQQLNKLGSGATVMHVYGSDIGKIKVPVRSRDEQTKIGALLEGMAKNISLVNEKIAKAKALQKSIINKVF